MYVTSWHLVIFLQLLFLHTIFSVPSSFYWTLILIPTCAYSELSNFVFIQLTPISEGKSVFPISI